jgi:hypothetical protein
MSKKRGKKHLEGRLEAPLPGVGDTKAQSVLPATRAYAPWFTVGAGIASLGTPVGIGVLHPVLGVFIAIVEMVAVLTIIGTALFGSQALSERAFRLLRWIGNRSEPLGPPSDHPRVDGHRIATGHHSHLAPRPYCTARAVTRPAMGTSAQVAGQVEAELTHNNPEYWSIISDI